MNKNNFPFPTHKTVLLLLAFFACVSVFLDKCQRAKEEDIQREINAFRGYRDSIKSINKDKTLYYKVDSSNFEVSFLNNKLDIRLERDENLQGQIIKIKKVLVLISRDIDLTNLKEVILSPLLNKELLLGIAFVPEIQKELKLKNSRGIVNSMGIVSNEAYKSKRLKDITDLFLQFQLEPDSFYIDKCFSKRLENESLQYTMECSSIVISLRIMESI